MAFEYYLGVDVDDKGTVTAALVEKRAADDDESASYVSKWVREFEADRDVAKVASELQTAAAKSPYTGRVVVVVNDTELRGRELVTALVETGITPIGIALSGSDAASQRSTGLAGTGADDAADSSGFIVSEHELVQTLDELHQVDDFKAEGHDQGQQRIVVGIGNYREDAHEAGDALDEISAEPRRSVEHSRFVISAALACWMGEQRSFDPTEHLGGWEPTTGEAKSRNVEQ